jgi:two-component system, sensor histidine kinase
MTAQPYIKNMSACNLSDFRKRAEYLGFNDLTKHPEFEKFMEFVAQDFSVLESEVEHWKNRNNELQEELVESSLYIRNAANVKSESIKRLQEVFDHLDFSPTIPTDLKSENLLSIVEQFHSAWSKKVEDQKYSTHSLHLLQTLFSNLPSGILIEDADRNIRFVNEKYCEFFAMNGSPQSFIGEDNAQLKLELPRLLVNETQYQARVEELIKDGKGIVGDELVTINRRRIRRDYIPIVVDGVFEGNVWIYTDVTIAKATEKKLRRSEEKYRGIIENMNIGLVELDVDLHVKYANQSFCSSTGFDLEELQAGTATDALCLSHFSNWTLQMDNSQTPEPKLQEFAVKNKRGELVWFMLTGAPIYSHRGVLNGCIGIYLDITRQKQLEQELREAKIKADENSKAKEMFLANMSHEIRTPMNVILGLAKQMGKSDDQAQHKRMLEGINNSAEILMVLVNDILDFSKIEAGELNLENAPFNLRKVINNINVLMRDKADEKGLMLNIKVDPAIAEGYVGDPNRIQQVLINLVGNGIKFTEDGHVSVQATLERRLRDKDRIRIVVSDSGIGMDNAFIGKIFDKFKQEDNSIARKFGGTGLGMSISKELVHLMGGEIEVKSVKGVGSDMIISLELPLVNDSAAAAADANAKEVIRLDGVRVLLVEDNEFNRMLATKILNDAGALVDECENGKEAIIACCKTTYQLILMDMQMPVMGGVESAFLLLNGVKISTPIIALTANAVKGERDKCIQAGMVDFISKPFEEKHLLQVCKRWLSGNGIDGFKEPEHHPNVNFGKGYDLTKLHRIANGNREFVKKMVTIFLRDVKERTNALRKHCLEMDTEAIHTIAHKMKPGIDDLGIEDLKGVVRDVERMSHRGECTSELNEAIEKLCSGLERIAISMQDDLKED